MRIRHSLVVATIAAIGIAISTVSASTADPSTRWRSAIANDNVTELATLLSATGSNAELLLATVAENGKTALMVACKMGDRALAEGLVAAGAAIDERTQTGGTAFMFAVLGDRLKLATWLHEQGADVDVRGSNGWSAVTIAAAKGLDETLDWLLDMGAAPDEADVYGFTPLMRAADNGHRDAVVRLLETRVDVNAVDERGNSALHHAVTNGADAIAALLVSAGADEALENRDGMAPRDMRR